MKSTKTYYTLEASSIPMRIAEVEHSLKQQDTIAEAKTFELS